MNEVNTNSDFTLTLCILINIGFGAHLDRSLTFIADREHAQKEHPVRIIIKMAHTGRVHTVRSHTVGYIYIEYW